MTLCASCYDLRYNVGFSADSNPSLFHEKSMDAMKGKIDALRERVKKLDAVVSTANQACGVFPCAKCCSCDPLKNALQGLEGY